MDYLAAVKKNLNVPAAVSSAPPAHRRVVKPPARAAAASRAPANPSQARNGSRSTRGRGRGRFGGALRRRIPNHPPPTISRNPVMGLTENNSLTYTASGNPCLDFFFHVVPDTPSNHIVQRLELAWGFDPLTALKLVCNLRGVRGTGKSDKEGWYTSALWLHEQHPKTLASNLRAFASFGYFKDLVEILYRIVEGSDVRKIEKAQWLQRKGSGARKRGLLKQKKEFMKRKEDHYYKQSIEYVDKLLAEIETVANV